MGFEKAQRRKVALKLAIMGPSGSGKTYSALRLAFGLGKRVALIDTENGSGSLYADLGDYDVMEIAAPFTPQKYIAAIQEAVKAGFDVLIIDSLSHAWAGDGGLLATKESLDARGGNKFTNWAGITKTHEQFKSAILESPIHIIATMRSKQDYVVENGAGGKQTPRKVGMAPIQREGMEYEFTTVFDVDMSHTAVTSKDRTGLFTDEVAQITEGHGKRLVQWLAGGSAPQARPEPSREPQERQPQERQPQERTSPPLQEFPSQRRLAASAYDDYGAPPPGPVPGANEESIPAGTGLGHNGTPACEECGKALTKAQEQLSLRNYDEPLCPACQKNKTRQPALAA